MIGGVYLDYDSPWSVPHRDGHTDERIADVLEFGEMRHNLFIERDVEIIAMRELSNPCCWRVKNN